MKEKYPDVFDETDKITLSQNSIAYIVGELQQYCLIDSERDVIADAFETFIGPSLRGGQGQFFTPRNVVKLLLSLVDPSPKDKIMDKTTPRLIQFHTLKNAVNPPFLGGFSIFNTVVA